MKTRHMMMLLNLLLGERNDMGEEIDKEVKRLLDPILDVFGGVDGGVSFAKLRHEFLPMIFERNRQTGKHDDFILMINQFSKLCGEMLK